MYIEAIVVFMCTAVCSIANSVMPVTINQVQDELPDCKGTCQGNNWAAWTEWDRCEGGECHLRKGKETRQTICFTLITPPPSRSDGGSKEELRRKGDWRATCIEKQERPCVREQSCIGEWTSWEKWGDCGIMGNAANATCSRSRRRFCHDRRKTRQSGSYCFGGPSSDTEIELCKNHSCPEITPKIGGVTNGEVSPAKTVKKKSNMLNHNTILIIAVAIGSLVFGALFVLLLLNLVRRSSGRDDESTPSRGDRWKRIGSTNTSSIGYSAGYAAAGDVMSPRLEFHIRSPSSATSTSLGSSASQQQFFGRGEIKSPLTVDQSAPVAGLLSVSEAVDSSEPPRRRSRLMHENVYWEITENTSSSENSDTQSSPTDGNREVVRNVLYGTTV